MTSTEILVPSVQRISTTFPSFLFALAILVVGYVIAKVAAGLVSRVLGRTHLDARTAEALGLTGPGAPVTVRSVVARIAFWLIMLFVLIGFFNQIGLTMVAEPLRASRTRSPESGRACSTPPSSSWWPGSSPDCSGGEL